MRDTLVAYKQTFNSPSGKKVLKDLMKSCNMLETTFEKDKDTMLFNEGARSVVLRILRTIGTDIDKLDQYIAEIELETKEEQYD